MLSQHFRPNCPYFGEAAGYAPVEGMCTPDRAGVLVKDSGFNCAFVVSHEIGHTLGMHHDKTDNACVDSPDTGSIMAPVVKSRISRYQWSRCSKQELAANINKFPCLTDAPTRQDLQIQFERDNNVVTIDGQRYDGERWDRDSQCGALYGPGWGTCRSLRSRPDQECRSLWCEQSSVNQHYCMGFVGAPLAGTERVE